jgi:hypothetical protein
MELTTKNDWQEAEARMNAWWAGEIIDRPAVQVRSPKAGVDRREWQAIGLPGKLPPEQMDAWYTDVDLVVERGERFVDATFWGGEAFPIVFPVAVQMVAITSAYLGCPYHIDHSSRSGWAEPIIDDWSLRDPIEFDPHNEWWQLSKALLDAAARRAKGRYYVGMPDLNAPGEVVALMRDTQRFLFDFMDDPVPIKPAIDEATRAWWRYWQAANGVVHQWIDGYLYWMGIWSDSPSADLQCDFNVMISPQMFDDYFLPGLEQQTRWIERTIFHLDGPEAIRHLDSLLSLPRLNGIQWVPGDGKPPMSQWVPLLRRIQARGRLIVALCEPWEVETLVSELEPEGLLLQTTCDSEEEARALLKQIPRWMAKRQWFIA